jgi:glycosyltransferase involved in cell wall biosynthesis
MVSRNHKLFWGSSYDRGLNYLLYMWPDIKEKYPDAELHICYGWDLFDKVTKGNPERQEWKKSMEVLMKQPGIFHYGRVGKEELAKIRKSCGIWAYPTDFREINCITALDCQFDGVVPVTIDLGALQETAKAGILVKGDIKDEKVQKVYLKELLDLMGNKKKWHKMSILCQKFTQDYHWPTIAGKWIGYFKKPISTPMVTVITPTIREGFWRIMSENLAKQTYKNFEWIIVDDYKEDRSEIAQKYAEKYNLTIRYLRGSKYGTSPPYARRCGLVRANNTAWKNAKGELLLWLQDFILIPDNGIEQVVDVYRHNQDSLIAPVDAFFDANKANTKNKEDWWDGEELILTTTGRNVRNGSVGLWETENPFNFEINYGAIPKKILDELNGFWEFMDDGLGYDNCEIAYRATKLGYRIIVDDTNVAKCVNLWPIIGGTSQNILSRERMLNPPRWSWVKRNTDSGKLPIKRDEKLDQSISLPFEVPKEIKDNDCAEWIRTHEEEIMKKW